MPLYAFGSNASGQLGIGNTEDTNTPKRCPLPESLLGRIKKIVAGGSHTLLLLNDGTVFCSGKSRDGKAECCTSPLLSSTSLFKQTSISDSEKRVKLCSAWWDGSVFVDHENQVFTAGLGSKGEQGSGAITASTALQKINDINEHPDQIREVLDLDSCVDHTVLVLDDGTAWGWGNGRRGKLVSDQDFVWQPSRLKLASESVARAVCGRDFTFLVYRNGDFEVFGTDKWGLSSQAPKRSANWKDVHASWGSIFVLHKDGSLECWGRNDHGQLAPPSLPAIEQLAVGSEHVVALTKDGKVISWGWGEHGNCGADNDADGDVKGRWNEIAVDPSEKVLGVAAGCASSFYWTDNSNNNKYEPSYCSCPRLARQTGDFFYIRELVTIFLIELTQDG